MTGPSSVGDNHAMNAEQNMLFGVLAVQLGYVSSAQVVQAASSWAADRSKGLAERLTDAGLVPADRAAMLRSLVDETLQANDLDTARAIESLGASQVFESFGGMLSLNPDGSVELGPTDTTESTFEDNLAVTSEHPKRYRLGGQEAETAGRKTTSKEAEIGRGGIGRVLLAFDEHLGREVAIKELLVDSNEGSPISGPSAQRLSNARARFLREARVTGQLEHPNIMPVYELGRRRSGGLYYTMRMVRGRTLSQALQACKSLTDRLHLLTHFIDLCQALAYAHSRGVVHRDVKPDNVMLGEFGETVVLDWGLAKVRGKRDIRGLEIEREIELLRDAGAGRTLEGAALGTPAYMSPEQAEGKMNRIDERSDVWSLGAVLYEILTGRPPYEGLTAFEVIGRVLKDPVQPVRSICPEAPAELASVCEKALCRNHQGRYAGAGELATDVQRFLTGGRVKAYDYPLWELLSRFARRHRAVLSVLMLALLVIAALGIWSHLLVVDERNRAVAAELDERQRRAEAQLEGARAAFLGGDAFEARAKLRGSLQTRDSAAARNLWLELRRQDQVWVRKIGDYINGLNISPDGRLIALGADGNNAFLLDARTREVRRVLRGHTFFLNWLSFSPDSRSLVTASADKTARIWDVASGTTRHVLRGHTGIVWNAVYSPDGKRIATASEDGTLRVWDAQTGKALRELKAGKRASAVAFSPDGKLLYGGGHQGQIQIWDSSTGENRGQVKASDRSANFIEASPDGRSLCGCAGDGVYLFDLANKNHKHLAGHTGDVTTVRFDPTGERIVSAGRDHQIRIWSARSGALLRVLEGHTAGVFSAAFTDKGRRIASAGWDQTARLWDLQTIGEARVLHGHGDMIWTASFTSAGDLLASGGDDGKARVWKIPSGENVHTFSHGKSVEEVTFDRAGGRLLTIGDGSLRIWDLATRAQLLHLGGSQNMVRRVFLLPDDRRILLLTTKGKLSLWDTHTGGMLSQVPTEAASNIDLRPDGKQAALGLLNGDLLLVDLQDPGRKTKIKGHGDRLYRLAYHPGGKLIASISADHVRLWDLQTKKSHLLWRDPKKQAYRMAFTPDGERLAFSVNTGDILLAPLAGGDPVRLRGHLDMASGVAISSDGKWLASTSEDASVRLWDMNRLRPAWHTAAVSTAPARVLTQRGWEWPSKPEKIQRAESTLEGVIERSGRWTDQTSTGLTCLWTWDDELQLWDKKTDRLLKSWKAPDIKCISAAKEGCLCLRDSGRAELFTRSGTIHALAESEASAIAFQENQILIAVKDSILSFSQIGEPLGQLARVDPGASALLLRGPDLIVGYRDGNLDLLDRSSGKRKEGLPLADLSARPVTALHPGPMNTLIVGFGDGLVGIWDPKSGQRLDYARLHGPIVKLWLTGDQFFAASELGDHLLWDMRVFGADYCELLEEIWSQVPVEWEGGHAVLRAPPADHLCTKVRD